MTFSRTLPLVVLLAAAPLWPAHAQFGGMPGMPGSSGFPGGPGFGTPQQPPAACQKLMALRDDVQKRGESLQSASHGKKKPSAEEACKLFKSFLAAEQRFIKGLEANSTTCGVPPEVIKQVKSQHAQTGQVGKNVCEVAARGPQPTGPTFSDALGTTPLVPDNSDQFKRGPGTFDTLTGNPLRR